MKIAKTAQLITPVKNWDELLNGERLHKQTQTQIEKYLPRCFGYHLLKLGHLSCSLDTTLSPITHHVNCAANENNIDLQADLQQLPLQDASIDLCIVAHEINYSNDPHQLLREIDRVLTLDGTLMLSAYNPISMFGFRSLFKPKNIKNTRLFFPNRVVDWLSVLGFEITQEQHFNFLPLEGNCLISNYVEKLGQQYAPSFCSAYFIVAKKQSAKMTHIKSPFKFKKPIINRQPIVTRRPSRT